MNFVVKNTTKWSLWDLVCPYACRGCGILGGVLCERCKKDNTLKDLKICPFCQRNLEGMREKCVGCDNPFEDFFAVGWREGVLEKLVKELKYESVRANARVLAELLARKIPKSIWEEKLTVVPLPTIGRHVRERGLDHTLMLAKLLAKNGGGEVGRILGRATNTVQVGTKLSERKRQAATTYEMVGKVESEKTYLLLDDIWTTGASMLAAEKVLRENGAKRIYGAVLAVGKAKD